MILGTRVKAFTEHKDQIPKSLLLFFLGSQLLYGIDFGFSAVVSKRYRAVIKHYTLFLSLFWIVYLCIACIIKSTDLWFWSNFIEYTAYFIVLNHAKYSAYNLVKDIYSISRPSFRCTEENLGYKIMAHVIVMIVMKIFFMYITCLDEGGVLCVNTTMSYYFWIYNIPWLGMDVLAATQIVIFLYIRLGVVKLNDYLQGREADLKVFRSWYLDLAGCYDKIRPLYDKMAKWLSYITELIFACHIGIQIAAPAVTAELVNSEVDAVRLLLNQRLVLCEDETKAGELNRMLQYTESRPLRHLVLRFVPLDMRLLTALVGLCTTYFIVIIQFTHLYD